MFGPSKTLCGRDTADLSGDLSGNWIHGKLAAQRQQSFTVGWTLYTLFYIFVNQIFVI